MSIDDDREGVMVLLVGLLIGSHSATGTSKANAIVLAEHDVAAAFGSTNAGGTIFHLAMFAERKCLCAVKLGALAKLVHAPLTSVLVFLRIHAKVVLGKTARTVRLKKFTVTTIQNIHFRVC